MADDTLKIYTPNINLVTVPVDSGGLKYRAVRSDIYGDKASNMLIIDDNIGKLKNRAVYLLSSTTPTANQYISTYDGINNLCDEMKFVFVPATNNTGTATLTLNSLSSVYIKKANGLGELIHLESNDLIAGNPVFMYYSEVDNAYVLVTANAGMLPMASTAQAGIVQLSNAVDSESQVTAPTSSAIKTVSDALGELSDVVSGKSPINHADTSNQYGQASSTKFGHAKLYANTGTNSDGSMTQDAITSAITEAKPQAGTGIEINGTNGTTVNITPPTSEAIGGVKAGTNVTINSEGVISVPSIPSSLPPSGTASGDLAGTYPSPTIKSGAVTDIKIGSRTLDQTITSAPSSTGTITEVGSWIIKVIKNLHGGDNWYDAPTQTINALSSGKANIIHTHNASDISAGTVDAARLPLATTSSAGAVKVDGNTVRVQNGVVGGAVADGMPTDIAGLLKGDGSTVSVAIAGTDYVATESDPTVPSWAKSASKPSYTASEVGAVPTTRTVNGKALSGNISLTAGDVGAAATETNTVVLSASAWSSAAPYTQFVTVPHVLPTDNPIVDVVLSDTPATAQAQIAAWQCVSRIISQEAYMIEAVCYDTKPATDIPIQVKVVR